MPMRIFDILILYPIVTVGVIIICLSFFFFLGTSFHAEGFQCRVGNMRLDWPAV